MAPRHVHIGAGSLGLGLVLPCCSGRFEILVLNRKGDGDRIRTLERERAYYLKSGASLDRITDFQIATYDDCALPTAEHPVVAAIRDPETLLVTTAVKHGLVRVGTLIGHAILSRDRGAPRLLVLACENRIDSRDVLREMVKQIDPNAEDVAVFLDTLVDRICTVEAVGGGSVTVSVEGEFEWAIERGIVSPPALRSLPPAIEVVDSSRFRLLRLRKLWLFNGTDVIVALRAKEICSECVPDGLDELGINRAIAFGLLASRALAREAQEWSVAGFSIGENRLYQESVLLRIRRQRNLVKNVVAEYVSDKPQPRDWLRKVNQRISEPIIRGSQDLLAEFRDDIWTGTELAASVHVAWLLGVILKGFESVV